MTTTDTSKLLQYQGRVVPWVTRWSGERSKDEVQLSLNPDTQELTLGYPDGQGESREPSGILWQREGLSRSGVPEYSQVNTYRQRSAMRKFLCQVCGHKINERPIQWLLAKENIDHTESGTVLTMSAPTCSSCIPVAQALCPHLNTHGWVIAKVLEYRLYGVYGWGVLYDAGDQKTKRVNGVYISYDRNYRGLAKTAICAMQQVAEFTKFTLEDT